MNTKSHDQQPERKDRSYYHDRATATPQEVLEVLDRHPGIAVEYSIGHESRGAARVKASRLAAGSLPSWRGVDVSGIDAYEEQDAATGLWSVWVVRKG